MSDNADPEQLLQRARAGDRAAMNALIRIYLPDIRTRVSGQLGRTTGSGCADDIVQEVACRMPRGVQRLQADGLIDFERWRGTAIRRGVWDALRRVRADQRAGRRLLDPLRAGAAEEAHPADGAEASESRAAIWSAVQSLRPRQAKAICLSYREDLGEARAAARMGCTVEAVHSLCERGVRRLRRELTNNRTCAVCFRTIKNRDCAACWARSLRGGADEKHVGPSVVSAGMCARELL